MPTPFGAEAPGTGKPRVIPSATAQRRTLSIHESGSGRPANPRNPKPGGPKLLKPPTSPTELYLNTNSPGSPRKSPRRTRTPRKPPNPGASSSSRALGSRKSPQARISFREALRVWRGAEQSRVLFRFEQQLGTSSCCAPKPENKSRSVRV